MKNFLLIIFSLILLISLAKANYYVLDISKVTKQYEFEIEIADDLLVYSKEKLSANFLKSHEPDTSLVFINKLKLCGADEKEEYQKIESNQLVTVLYKKYGYVIYQAKDRATFSTMIKISMNNRNVKLIIPTGKRTTLIENAKPNPNYIKAGDIQNLVNSVNQTKLYNTVVDLAAFNRYSLLTCTNCFDKNITSAGEYLKRQINTISSTIPVTYETFTVSGKSCFNVIAKIEGTTDLDRWYIVGAHYDSTSERPNQDAPGAEDNASGSAGVLEMLRTFYNYRPTRGTFFFIWYSGEEQGLYGSKANVNNLVSRGDKSKVIAALTHDMIGYRKTNFGVIIETSRTNNTLFDPIYRNAITYQTQLALRFDNNPFGSDHVSYLNAGIASTLAIDQDWGSYPNYHKTSDKPDALDYALLTSITKLEVAAIALISGN